ncbi:MAG: GAF domain-containing protein [Acidobacteriota bacterium]|nr:GAF domain-containing protein [Acidobacteriota bacterium]
MTISAHPPRRPLQWSPEERYRFLSAILESFAGTLDLEEVLRRIVSITLEQFGAERVLLIHPVIADATSADVRYVVTAPHVPPVIEGKTSIPLTAPIVKRMLDSAEPIEVLEGDPDSNTELAKSYQVRSALIMVLRPQADDPWAVVMQQCTERRQWTEAEISLFAEIGRYATLALNNTLSHERAVLEIAKASAILDQIPEPAAIYDATGRLERMNAAAKREGSPVLHHLDGSSMQDQELPWVAALRGESVNSEFLIRDPRANEDRIVNLKSAPIRDRDSHIIGSVVLSRDVTEERHSVDREQGRRRRAEVLANLALDPLAMEQTLDNLDEPARRIARAFNGTVRIYLYHPSTGVLNIAGYAGTTNTGRFREYFQTHSVKPGEGLPGTVFQIGRPLFFYDIHGNDIIDFARDEEEKRIHSAMNERSLIAAPIESYGDRIGALIVSQSDPGRKFDAEDLEFAQAVAERIGAASHIHRLTRMSQEGHRAADELARREVDARVRFETVLETAPIGIAALSADELRFELANARFIEFATQFGKVPPDTRLLGLRVDEVIPGFELVVRHVAETGEARVDEEIEIVHGNQTRYVNRTVSAVRGRFSGTTQSITVLIQDVTEQVAEDRINRERESRRRRHAECLANIGLAAVTMESSLENLNEPARRIADAVGGSAMIYMYNAASGELRMTGMASPVAAVARFSDYLNRTPYRPGEGIPGTVFQIGRPLLFSDVKGNAVIDFGRDEDEKKLIAAMREQSLIACPIESYGEAVGAIVVTRNDDDRNFDAEDLEFVQSVAERLGAAIHIHQLTRISQEGHRAAEDLARREVDARVRFEAVLETAPIGVAVISADELRFELANARWLEFASQFGKISNDTRVVDLRVAEVIPGWEQTLKQVAESGEMRFDREYETFIGGAPAYVNRIISAVRGRFSGITQSLTVLIQDVTDQVKAKREIEALAQMMAERSARLDSILGSMTDGLWVYDAAGDVIDVNQAALTMFGLGSRSEAVNLGSFERFYLRYPDGRPIPRDDLPYARALRGLAVPDYLAIGRHLISGRDLDLSIAAAPIESNGVVGAVLVIRDITALQELDRKKDEFLSVASHELRTPLTTIKGYTQLLAQSSEDLANNDRATYLTAVLSEIDRMMGLITELLDVSRIETNRLQLEPQPVRWLEFLQRRATAFRVQNPGRKIGFEAKVPETLLMVDPDRIRQVVDNLLSNAIKYSPETSEISIHAEVVESQMLTSVIDHGIGIPRDEIPRLFERFHRARNVSSRYYGGLGLGLYIAKAIVEAHKGAISVISEEGAGATFTIRLPMP